MVALPVVARLFMMGFCSRFISFCECIEISRFPKESDAMLNFLLVRGPFLVRQETYLVVQKFFC